MANALKAGGLGAESHVGIPPEFANSMAKAMEDALNALLSSEGKPTVSTENTAEVRDRRIMFLAIARGVVEHLEANEDAFTVRRDDDSLIGNHNVRISKT